MPFACGQYQQLPSRHTDPPGPILFWISGTNDRPYMIPIMFINASKFLMALAEHALSFSQYLMITSTSHACYNMPCSKKLVCFLGPVITPEMQA